MDKNGNKEYPNYRWVILIMIFLTCFAVTYSQFQVSALAYKIMNDLQLSSGQLASIMLAPMLPGILLAIISGVLGDKFGVKKVVSIGYIVSCIGVSLRYFASSYWELFLTMACIGVVGIILNSNAAKMVVSWFPRKQVGTAMGLFMASTSLGVAASQATTPWFSSTNRAFLFAGIMLLITAVLWVVLVKNKPEGTIDQPAMPITNYLGKVAKNKRVWIVSLGMMFFMGAQMTYAGFLPAGLSAEYGTNPAKAGLMASLFTLGGLMGSIIVPILSDRIGLIKPVVIIMSCMGTITMYGGWLYYQQSYSWVLLITGGFMLGACAPLLMSFPALLPEVGPVYAGSAGGLIGTLQMLGAFFIPSMVIAPLAGSNFKIIFSLACLCCALIGLVTIFLPELGHRKQISLSSDCSNEATV